MDKNLTKIIKNLLLTAAYLSLFTLIWFRLKTISANVTYQANEYDYVARGIYLDLIPKYKSNNDLWNLYDSYVQEKLPSFLYELGLGQQGVKPILNLNNLVIAPSWWEIANQCNPKIYSQTNCMTITSSNWTWPIDGKSKDQALEEIDSERLSSQAISDLNTIDAARNVSRLFSFGCLILISLISLYFWGVLASFIAPVFLLISPLFDTSTIRALGDSFLLFFLLNSLYLTAIWYKRVDYMGIKKAILFSVFIGINLGLAIASKLNGTMASIIFTFFAFYKYLKSPNNQFKIITVFLVSIMTTFIVFIILNPFTWSNPFINTKFMITHRWIETYYYEIQPGFKPLFNFENRLWATIYNTIFSRNNYITPGNNISYSFILFMFGCIGLFSDLKNRKNQNKRWVFFIIIYGILTWVIMGVYLKLDWDRYYLPFVPVVILINTRGLLTIMDILQKVILKSSKLKKISLLNFFQSKLHNLPGDPRG